MSTTPSKLEQKVFNDVTLPESAPIFGNAECLKHRTQTPEECSAVQTTNNEYTGQLRIAMAMDSPGKSKSSPYAEFGSPSLEQCEDLAAKKCNILLKYKGDNAQHLVHDVLKSDEARNYWDELLSTSGASANVSGPYVNQAWSLLDSPHLFSGIAIFIVLVTIVPAYIIFSRNSRSEAIKRQGSGDASTNRRRRTSADGSKQVTGGQGASTYNQALQLARENNERINQLDKSLIELRQQSSMLLELKQSLNGLQRDYAELEAKLRISLSRANPSHDTGNSQSAPPHQPLSQELLRQAVVKNDYNLISSFPHKFLTEASDSREERSSLTEFILDGSHENWRNHSRSEFIAINVDSETVLIPNIVPDCTPPDRTLQSLASIRKIYSQLPGSTGLSIHEFAVISNSGTDKYILNKPGTLS